MRVEPLLAAERQIVVQELVRDAFSGFPWYETLDDAELNRRWLSFVARPGFTGLIALADDESDEVMGGIWWDDTSPTLLATERGPELADFAFQQMVQRGLSLVWERDLAVFRRYQGQGVGRILRSAFLEEMSNQKKRGVLTRMREDNEPVLKLARGLGFQPTGIFVSCSVKADTCHQYWYWVES